MGWALTSILLPFIISIGFILYHLKDKNYEAAKSQTSLMLGLQEIYMSYKGEAFDRKTSKINSALLFVPVENVP